MANWSRLRGAGLWTLNSVVDPTEFEAIDDRISKTINADGGSTHAPSSAIVIGGSGLSVTGPLAASGAVTCSNTVACSGAVTCTSTLTMNSYHCLGNAEIDGTLTVDTGIHMAGAVISGNFPFQGNVEFQGTATCSAAFQCNDTATFQDAVEINASLVCSTTCQIVGNFTAQGGIDFSGANTFVQRFYHNTGPSLAYTLDVTPYDVVWIGQSASAGTTVVTLKTSSPTPAAGTRVLLTTKDYAPSFQFEFNTGVTKILTFPGSVLSWGEVVFDGTVWFVAAWGGSATVP